MRLTPARRRPAMTGSRGLADPLRAWTTAVPRLPPRAQALELCTAVGQAHSRWNPRSCAARGSPTHVPISNACHTTACALLVPGAGGVRPYFTHQQLAARPPRLTRIRSPRSAGPPHYPGVCVAPNPRCPWNRGAGCLRLPSVVPDPPSRKRGRPRPHATTRPSDVSAGGPSTPTFGARGTGIPLGPQ